MNAFTPGPWQASPGGLVVHSVDDELVAEVFEGDPYVAKVVAGPSLAEQIANSRLIAAAPALYEALEALLENDDEFACARCNGVAVDAMQSPRVVHESDCLVPAAAAALALARGESEGS